MGSGYRTYSIDATKEAVLNMADILFLDDSRERHAIFTNEAPIQGHVLHRAWTASEAIDLLKRHQFVQAFLDHDLSEEDIMCEVGGKSVVPTGMAVVDFIMTMATPPKYIVVHSCNVPAAIAMVAKLKQHPEGILIRQIPFPELIRIFRDSP